MNVSPDSDHDRIHILDPSVINKIAAGEVIQRPVNCIKEMLENSLDAKSTTIQISVKGGGLKYICIHDNGIGICKEDLPIACRRWTTSKLSKFEDLQSISTYGFRGEALASISYIARFSITTMTKDSPVAYRANYSNGELFSSDGSSPDPKPIAGTVGTQIIVEDLFYNYPLRAKSMNQSEEYSRILDVVSRYAVHNSGVSFNLKKLDGNSNKVDISTKKNNSIQENIREIFGSSVVKDLIHIEINESDFKVNSYISGPSYSAKSTVFILFINNRLVENIALKKAIKNTYSMVFGKTQNHPWVYFSLFINDLKMLDVNVHPTKIQVIISDENTIIPMIIKKFTEEFDALNSSRSFGLQENLLAHPEGSYIQNSQNSSNPWQINRSDSKATKLERYLSPDLAKNRDSFPKVQSKVKNRENPMILSMGLVIMELKRSCHEGLKNLFQNNTFVGFVSAQYVLVQYETNLYMCDIHAIGKELFFQECLQNLGEMPIMQLSEPVPIKPMIILAMSHPEAKLEESFDEPQLIAQRITEKLESKNELLKDYFGITINDGYLKTLPEIILGYIPDLTELATFLLRLYTDVSWESESQTLVGIARELGNLYTVPKMDESELPDESLYWNIEHLILNGCRLRFFPPTNFAQNRVVIIVAQTEKLYRIFERC